MKLKYKKAVLLVSMGTMFISLMAFSMGDGSKNKEKPVQKAGVQTEAPFTENDYTLTISKDEQIKNLVQSYFKASVDKDMEALSEAVTNIDYVNENQLKVKYEYVEDVKNIECHIMDGPEEGTYLVYAYSELKIRDIDTLAPGLSRFYVVTGEDGRLKIFFGADTKIENFIAEADASPEVQKLAKKVQLSLEEAVSNDKELMEFNKKLTEKAGGK